MKEEDAQSRIKSMCIGDWLELSNGELESIRFISHDSYLQQDGTWSKGPYVETANFRGRITALPMPEALRVIGAYKAHD